MADLILCCVILVPLCVLLWCVLYWWPRRRLWALAAKMPGPVGYPIIGNSLMFCGKLMDSFNSAVSLYKVYGPVIRLWFGSRLMIVLTDPEDIQQVLGNGRIRNRDENMTLAMLPFFGNGLLSTRDEQWRIHRKLITPTFHFKILETFLHVFGRKSQILVQRLEEVADGRTFDTYDYLSLCTMDAICETAIGTAMNTQGDGHSDFLEMLYEAVKCVHSRALKPWLLIDWLYPFTADGKRAKPVMKIMKDFGEMVIVQKLDEYKRGIRSPGIMTSGDKRVSSFLDMLIEASETQGSLLTAQEMQDEVKTMAAAGLETTATAMSFFLQLIALHPAVQDELHKEVDEIFGDDITRAATAEDIHKMHAMDRAIKETLRLFPVVNLLPREITENIPISNGYIVPKGSTTLVFVYTVHRLEKYFPDPEKFWPDRWLPENSINRHPYAYLPFSAGPRNCVGQKYAQLQMKSILSQILRRFNVTTDYKMHTLNRLEMSVTICIDQDLRYMLQMTKRKGK